MLSLASTLKSKENLAAGLLSNQGELICCAAPFAICHMGKGSAIYNAILSALSLCLFRFSLRTKQKLEWDKEVMELFMGSWDENLPCFSSLPITPYQSHVETHSSFLFQLNTERLPE